MMIAEDRRMFTAVQKERDRIALGADMCAKALRRNPAVTDFVEALASSAEAASDLARPQRIGVVATAGDRRDEDIRALGRLAGMRAVAVDLDALGDLADDVGDDLDDDVDDELGRLSVL